MPPRADLPLLFVYGTLMRGEPAHRLLLGRASFVEEGHADGLLLDLGRFPGMIDGPGRVGGEVWRLEQPELLRTLDEYEGYNFERRREDVTLTSGPRVPCWLYRYKHTVVRRKIIPEGHWRRHRWR